MSVDRLQRIVISALSVCALIASPAWGYIATDRWNFTATNGSTGTWGTPTTVTWSFAPDGTSIPSATSSLVSFLNANFGDFGSTTPDPVTGFQTAPWFPIFNTAFSRLSALSGISYVYEPHDDGTPFLQGNVGLLGVRGDMRLSAKSYPPDQSTTLASNFFPDYSEMMINVDQVGYLGISPNNYRRFRNVLMHEGMHGLGVSHVYSTPIFLLNPALSSSIDGPQLDDVLALQRLYGDVLEKNGGNDTAGSATPLGSLASAQTLVRGTLGDSIAVAGTAVDFVSIDDSSDADFFSFTLASPLAVTLALSPKGTTYQMGDSPGSMTAYNTLALSDLSLALFDSNGTTQIGATANAQGAGLGESIIRELNAGTYYARITGAQSNVQLYQIAVSGATIGADQLTWVGANAGVWNVGTTPNFHNGSSADVFRNGDSVTFNNSAVTTTVNVNQAVALAAMTIQASANYQFTGSSGITVSALIVDGGGAATLGNNGNNLHNVDVRSGSLTISGTGNAALSGTVRVASSAMLNLATPQSFAATSQLSGAGTVVGAVAMLGTIAPGDGAGLLTLSNGLTLASTSVLSIELGGLTGGSQYDVLSVGGQAALGGTLAVSLINGFQPAVGAEFSILTASSILDTFATQMLPNLAGGLVWHTTYLTNEVVLSVSAGVSYDPADFDEDGHVDADDLNAWRSGFGTIAGATHQQGDANGDFKVDGTDFLIWQRRLNGQGQVTASSQATPEPGAWGMMLAALAGMAVRVRRRASRSL